MRLPNRRTTRPFAVLALGAALCPLAAGREAAPRDRWYAITLGGTRVGYLRQWTRPDESRPSLVRTTDEMRIVLNRLGTRISLVSTSDAWETSAGQLKKLVSEMSFSSQAVRTEAEVADGVIVVTTSSGGSPFVKRLPYSGELLGPEGVRVRSRDRLGKSGDVLRYQTYSTEANKVMDGTRTVTGRESLRVGDRDIPVLKAVERYADYPIESTVWLDAEGDEVRSSASSPFGEMSFLLSTREEVIDLAAAGRIPEEQYARTLVRSHVRLPQARLIESMTVALRRTGAGAPVWPSLAGPGQTVLEKDPGRLVLRIDRPDPSRPGSAKAEPEDIRANMYLDTGDALVGRAVREALGAESDAFRKAVLLKTWVATHMTFDLGIAFAPSSEVIRNLRGTCAEYAILLATLARAAGIPSRYLMGVAYLNGMWGGHAWTELLIDGTWVPMDAAVNGPCAADAARFYFAESSLDAGPGDSLAAAQQLFGSIAIDVLEYRLNGRTVRVDPSAPLFTAAEGRYVNPGLGLSVLAPEGLALADMDRVWPDKTLVAMRSADGRSVRILQEGWPPDRTPVAWIETLLDAYVKGGKKAAARMPGYDAYRTDGPKTSAAAFRNGVDVWVVVAEGRDPAALLDGVLGSLTVEPYDGPVGKD